MRNLNTGLVLCSSQYNQHASGRSRVYLDKYRNEDALWQVELQFSDPTKIGKDRVVGRIGPNDVVKLRHVESGQYLMCEGSTVSAKQQEVTNTGRRSKREMNGGERFAPYGNIGLSWMGAYSEYDIF